MVKSYLTTGLRQLVAQKLYSVINIVGLAVGLASVVLIGLYVRHELSYESMFSDADRIFRISRDYYAREGSPMRVPASNNAPVAPALLADFPEIERVARLFGGATLFRRGDAMFNEQRFRWADPALLEMFALDWIAGDPKTALAEPTSLVITASLATKYFGADNPVGQTITIGNGRDVTVTGVIRDLPGNTHLAFDALAPMEALASAAGPQLMESWDSNTDFHTYFELRKGASVEDVERRLPEFMTRHFTAQMVASSGMSIMNVRDIHVRSTRDEEWKPPSSLATIYASATIAAMILLIACINFMNLSTARAAKRAREVGVRKSLGASRAQLMAQFLGESVGTAAIAMLIATMIVELALPAFGAFVGADLSFDYFETTGAGGMGVWLMALTVLVGVAAGSYPAFYLSAYSSAKVLKGDVSRGSAGARFRNVLVTVQFAIAIVLLVGTAVVYQQTRFARELDLGFDKDQVVVLAASTGNMRRQWSALKTELERVPGVASVTASHYTPFSWDDNRWPVRRPGQETLSRIQYMAVDYGFFETYRIDVLEGRGFSPDFANDLLVAPQPGAPPTPAGFVVNESAARLLGWTAGAALDQPIEIAFGPVLLPGTIVGIARDTYFESVAVAVRPMIYVLAAEPRGALFQRIDDVSIRLEGADLRGTLAGIDAAWRSVLPNEPIVRHFLDQDFEAQYRSEARQMQMFTSFAALAIFIACLGLLGLAWFSTERRTKEIGIRKTLGGSVWDVVSLFTTEFSRLVLLANLVAWPVAYLVMQRWLSGFAYRVDLSPTVFVGSALVALAVALLTVGGVAARAASVKPLSSLRYE